MTTSYLTRYATLIRTATAADLAADCTLGGRLVMDRHGDLAVSYAPFDHVNAGARIVLVGITPGRQQAVNALCELRRQLVAGADVATAAERAKGVASFSGSMRKNLIDQLDYFEVNRLLGLRSCADLFGAQAHLVHYTSALRYPVFVAGRNYAGAPAMAVHPLLRRQLFAHFAEEAHTLRGALFVPLGDKVAKALQLLAQAGVIDPARILEGLQHPSGANAERIAYLLGRKPKAALSTKTRADLIDGARAAAGEDCQTAQRTRRHSARIITRQSLTAFSSLAEAARREPFLRPRRARTIRPRRSRFAVALAPTAGWAAGHIGRRPNVLE